MSTPARDGSRNRAERKRRRLALLGKVSLVYLVILLGAVALSLRISHADSTRLDIANSFEPPVWAGGSWAHALGTDDLGRDILARLLYGARVSLTVGVLAVALAAVLGVALGLVAGYRRGWIDAIVLRFVDTQLSLPLIILAMPIVLYVGPSITTIVVVIALASWPQYTRVVRSEVMSIRTSDYVCLAEVAGLSEFKIILRHVLPNIMPSAIVLATLDFGKAVMYESTLSFLGLGVQPPDASWGLMIAEARSFMIGNAWLIIAPSIALGITTLAVNLFGDLLRSHLDPTLRDIQ